MTERAERFTVERSLPGERFDRFLAARYPAVSRGTLQRLHIKLDLLLQAVVD